MARLLAELAPGAASVGGGAVVGVVVVVAASTITSSRANLTLVVVAPAMSAAAATPLVTTASTSVAAPSGDAVDRRLAMIHTLQQIDPCLKAEKLVVELGGGDGFDAGGKG